MLQNKKVSKLPLKKKVLCFPDDRRNAVIEFQTNAPGKKMHIYLDRNEPHDKNYVASYLVSVIKEKNILYHCL